MLSWDCIIWSVRLSWGCIIWSVRLSWGYFIWCLRLSKDCCARLPLVCFNWSARFLTDWISRHNHFRMDIFLTYSLKLLVLCTRWLILPFNNTHFQMSKRPLRRILRILFIFYIVFINFLNTHAPSHRSWILRGRFTFMLHIRGISLPQCAAPSSITIVGRKATAGNRLRKFVILHDQPSSPSRTRCIENTFDRAMPAR